MPSAAANNHYSTSSASYHMKQTKHTGLCEHYSVTERYSDEHCSNKWGSETKPCNCKQDNI